MVAVYIAAVPFSITHLDLARDMGIALDIVDGVAFPAQGPVLAPTLARDFHLGPAWYYLLALPLAATHSWLATVFVVGVVAAAKLPLAYAVGARLVDSRFGLLWALLLLLPGWATFEPLLVLHQSLISACTLALLWCCLRYFQEGRGSHLIAAAFLLALAPHAHPSTYGLVLIMAVVLLLGWLRAGHPAGVALAATLAFAVPFAPYLVHQSRVGFPAFAAAASYFESEGGPGAVGNLPALLRGITFTGPETVLRSFLGDWGAGPTVVALAYGVVYATALAGLVSWLRRGAHRRLIAASIALVLALALSVAAVRLSTPYYMTFVVTAPLAGVLALGIRACADLPPLSRLLGPIVGIVAALALIATGASARALSAGAYRFAFTPLFDVQAPGSAGIPLPFVPAYAIAESGRFLCAHRELVVHGAYAVHLLHDYALEARLGCYQRPLIRLGGAAPRDAVHVTGIAQSMARVLGARATGRVGPLALSPVAQVLSPAQGSLVRDHRYYPPVPAEYGAPQRRELGFVAGADEAVLVTNLDFAFAADPEVTATVDGRSVTPVARDGLTTAFVCTGCDPAQPHQWSLDVRAPAPERVEIVTVRTAS